MSNLVDKLKEVHLSGGSLSDDEREYLEKHIVRDVPEDLASVKVVFLMESPHTDEKEKGFPLAGKSGKNVTKDLIKLICSGVKGKDPIGELVEESKVCWLSIMNVCLLPLQKTPYENNEKVSDTVRTLLCALKEIKYEMERGGDLCPISKDVYEVIINDLACRIVQTKCQCPNELLLVPFGEFARRSLAEVKRRIGQDSMGLHFSEETVPHPTPLYGHWKKYKKDKLAAEISAWLSGSPSVTPVIS